jgi:hypothetical protein
MKSICRLPSCGSTIISLLHAVCTTRKTRLCFLHFFLSSLYFSICASFFLVFRYFTFPVPVDPVHFIWTSIHPYSKAEERPYRILLTLIKIKKFRKQSLILFERPIHLISTLARRTLPLIERRKAGG